MSQRPKIEPDYAFLEDIFYNLPDSPNADAARQELVCGLRRARHDACASWGDIGNGNAGIIKIEVNGRVLYERKAKA